MSALQFARVQTSDSSELCLRLQCGRNSPYIEIIIRTKGDEGLSLDVRCMEAL